MLYEKLDQSGGGAGVSCIDLVGFVEGPDDYDSGGAAAAAFGTGFAASAAVAVQDEEGAMGKLLRRAQATVVEAAQVLHMKYYSSRMIYIVYGGAMGCELQGILFFRTFRPSSHYPYFAN